MLSASLAMIGHDTDAREMMQLSCAPGGVAKSIAQYKTRQPYDNPFLRDLCDRVDQGLRKAGMPEARLANNGRLKKSEGYLGRGEALPASSVRRPL